MSTFFGKERVADTRKDMVTAAEDAESFEEICKKNAEKVNEMLAESFELETVEHVLTAFIATRNDPKFLSQIIISQENVSKVNDYVDALEKGMESSLSIIESQGITATEENKKEAYKAIETVTAIRGIVNNSMKLNS